MIAVTLDEGLRAFIDAAAGYAQTVLIADEAHNYGATGFISDPPEAFQYRIGLSATPIRQYDPQGTARLFEYFRTEDQPAYTFTLNDAIRAGCLTPYRYHIHRSTHSRRMDRVQGAHRTASAQGFGADDGIDIGLTERQEQLLRERRGLIEQAEGKLTHSSELLAARSLNAESHVDLLFGKGRQAATPRSTNRTRPGDPEGTRISTHMYTSVETSGPAAASSSRIRRRANFRRFSP